MRLAEVIASLPTEKAEAIIEEFSRRARTLDSLSSLTLGLNPFTNTIEINAAKKASRLLTEMTAEMASGLTKRTERNDPKDSYRVDL